MTKPTPSVVSRDADVREDLLQSNLAFQLRVSELASANERLQREIALEAHRLQFIMAELALAAARLGDWQLASVIRTVAAAPDNLSSVAACGRNGERACPQHGLRACARCRAHVPELLSTRERDVLRRLTEGARSPGIATHLRISVATVEVHRRNIMRKLDLHTIADLTKYALREGLTSL